MLTPILSIIGILFLVKANDWRNLDFFMGDEKYPFLVSLQYDSGKAIKHICTGSILTETWILTAAHCVTYLNSKKSTINPENLYIFIGIKNLNVVEFLIGNPNYVFKVKSVFIHQEFNFGTAQNDIALLELKTSLNLSGNSTFKALNIRKKFNLAKVDYEDCFTVGFQNGDVNYVPLTIFDNLECEETFEMDDNHICTDYRNEDNDLCQAESGGPLICQNEQIGVATFLLGCNTEEYPNIFTKLEGFIGWIEKIMNRTYSIQNQNWKRDLVLQPPPKGWRDIYYRKERRRKSAGLGILDPRRRPGRPNRPWPRPRPPNRPRPRPWPRPRPRPRPWPRPRPPNRPRPRPNRPRPFPKRPGRPVAKPYYNRHRFGTRRGGLRSYRTVRSYVGRRTYYSHVGGFRYYGVHYYSGFGYGRPLGLWYGSPILFWYRPWFLMDYYLWHLYFFSELYQYHMWYGYGYHGHGYPGNYMDEPPPSYATSYCQYTATGRSSRNTSLGLAASRTSRTAKSTAVSEPPVGYKSGQKQNIPDEKVMYQSCKSEPPGFYTASNADLCPKHKVFCGKKDRDPGEIPGDYNDYWDD